MQPSKSVLARTRRMGGPLKVEQQTPADAGLKGTTCHTDQQSSGSHEAQPAQVCVRGSLLPIDQVVKFDW